MSDDPLRGDPAASFLAQDMLASKPKQFRKPLTTECVGGLLDRSTESLADPTFTAFSQALLAIKLSWPSLDVPMLQEPEVNLSDLQRPSQLGMLHLSSRQSALQLFLFTESAVGAYPLSRPAELAIDPAFCSMSDWLGAQFFAGSAKCSAGYDDLSRPNQWQSSTPATGSPTGPLTHAQAPDLSRIPLACASQSPPWPVHQPLGSRRFAGKCILLLSDVLPRVALPQPSRSMCSPFNLCLGALPA